MQLTSSQDIAAPLAYVFDRACDFDRFTRMALREGVQVRRDDLGAVEVGSIWQIALPLRGRIYHCTSRLAAWDAPHGYRIDSQTDTMTIIARVDLLALSPNKTCATVTIDLQGKTLAGRLLVQTLKLARMRGTQKLAARLQSYGDMVANEYRKV
jgi:hypothetical protein